MNEQLNMYLSGRRETGILLIAKPGTPLLEDAMAAAGKLLGTDQESLYAHPDFLFLDKAESSIGVDDVVPIFERASLKPAISNRIAVVINNFEKLTEQAQNKLLKLIEDGENVILVGVCHDEQRVLNTIKSRMRLIKYIPKSYVDYVSEERNKGIDGVTSSIHYFITNGCIFDDSYREIYSVFSKVYKAFVKKDPTGILLALGQVKEKDKDNYAELYTDYTPNLYSFLSSLCMHCLYQDAQSEMLMPTIPSYKPDALRKAIEILSVSNSKTVNKNDMFYDLTKFVFCLLS